MRKLYIYKYKNIEITKGCQDFLLVTTKYKGCQYTGVYSMLNNLEATKNSVFSSNNY